MYLNTQKLNTYAMKKLLLFAVLTITVSFAYGQRSIDRLFDKYAGKDGFTTVTIDGNLLKFLHCLGDNEDENSLPEKITEIRILAQENDSVKVDNFYDLVIKDIDLRNYDEFMRVKKTDNDLRMLVRSEGNKFKEFLLISGGSNNAVVQIKGSITYGEARRLSRSAEKNHGIEISSSIN
jgi:hypothetical protein